MAATGSPSPSQPNQNDDVHHSQPQDPNPTQPPQHSETLDLPNSPQSVQNSQQLEPKVDHQSGTTIHTSLSESIVLTDVTDTDNLKSPNANRRVNKRKKTGFRKTYKRKRPMKKVQTLTSNLNAIPFVFKQSLDFDKFEDVLKRLGLYDFSKIEFDRSLRTDLIVQLIVNYDAKKRCSYVNDLRVNVNRADLARALKLPPAKQDRGSSGVEEVDLDSEVFPDDAIGFIEEFVLSSIVLHDVNAVMPAEIVNWIRCVKDGHPEKLDPARLIWFMVEKELTQGDKLVDCYYASHLQQLIKSQRPSFFNENADDDVGDDGEELVIADEEKEEKEEIDEKEEKDENIEKVEKVVVEEEENVSLVQEQKVELNLGTGVEEIAQEEVVKDDETIVEAAECKEEVEEQVDFKNVLGEHFLQRCQSSGLNSFVENKVQEFEGEQVEDVDDEDQQDKQVEYVEDEDEQVEHVEDEDQQDEQAEHVEDADELDEQVQLVGDEDEEEEAAGERMDEGFDIEANDDSLDRDGLTDNFLQGVETSHNPYNSHGMSSMDLFGSRDGSFMSHGGPSFYNNGGKRVMEPEEDIHHLDQNSKRLKTNEPWDQKQNDIGYCFDQIQQWMQKAKTIHESKERNIENLQYSQQIAIEQLQERQQILEMIIKTKDEELEKKHTEVFRLERELYLMCDLLAGYRKAMNDTRVKFSEYRKRVALKEEPLYKDAGPGGLVLSTREIEKQRLKQEEDMKKFQILAKNIEEECVSQLEVQSSRLSPMVDRLVFIGNEVQRLKEIATQPKETRDEPSAELEPSVEPEETQKSVDEDDLPAEPEKNQKSMDEDQSALEPGKIQKSMDVDESFVEPEKNQDAMDEDVSFVVPEKNQNSMNEDGSSVEPEKNSKSLDVIPENDARMEGDTPDAGESEEKGGGEED